MTTIAYKNRVLASDSRASSSGLIISDSVQKVFCIENYYLFGCAGTMKNQKLILDLLKGDHWKGAGDYEALDDLVTKLDERVAALIVSKRDIFLLSCSGYYRHELTNDYYYSVGSGCDVASGAMYAGASAEEAVAAAIKHNAESGGAIQSVRLV